MTVQKIEDLEKLKQELLEHLIAKEESIRYNKISTIFPDEGPFKRSLYAKHIAFMNASLEFSQRAFIAANRVGKSLTAACEITYHTTGRYPHWWEGKRFLNANHWWAVGKSTQTTKEAIIETLLGKDEPGTGTIPKEYLEDIRKKSGGGDFVEKIKIKHISGDISTIVIKTYEQEQDSFMGTKKDGIWLDEEPNKYYIFTECLTRLSDKFNPGLLICTFTPLRSLSDVVQQFIPGGKFPEGNVNPKAPYRYITNVTWEDIPHMNEDQKKQFLSSYSEHEKYARSMGLPGLGAGAIYPYPEPEITCAPFKIPGHWPRAYGLDVGWNKTAAIWGAKDPESDVIYLYSEHYESAGMPVIHAKAIKARGDWIEGTIDIAARGRQQGDGRRLIDMYEAEDLFITRCENDTESGLFTVSQRFMGGGLKIFTTCANTLDEYRVYCRNEDGKINKKNDHLMDAMRYLIMKFDDIAQEPPCDDYENRKKAIFGIGRNDVTGY
jgi:phage terminase large subunit-like protein